MDLTSVHERRIVWAFWIACGLVVVGAIVPFLLGGISSRMNVVVVPFVLAAFILGACARLHRRGRLFITALYFLASLAIVYGILAMIAVPVRLAVTGTCPPEPARCLLGLERPLTGAEDTALTFAIGMGIVAILTAFFGLVVLYRQTAIPPFAPPVRRIDPVATTTSTQTSAPASKPETAAEPERAVPEPEPQPELAPPPDELELPAPAEALELPAPAADATAHEHASPAPPARRNSRRRHTSKAPPESPPASNIDA